VGGFKGEFPVINQEWGVVCMFDSLAARMAIQNVVFEGGSLDVLKESVDVWSGRGRPADGGHHGGRPCRRDPAAHFANEWLKTLQKERPGQMLKVVSAMSSVRAWSKDLTPPEHVMSHDIPVNMDDRRHAGFLAFRTPTCSPADLRATRASW
jgi:hypothetical protein